MLRAARSLAWVCGVPWAVTQHDQELGLFFAHAVRQFSFPQLRVFSALSFSLSAAGGCAGIVGAKPQLVPRGAAESPARGAERRRRQHAETRALHCTPSRRCSRE